MVMVRAASRTIQPFPAMPCRLPSPLSDKPGGVGDVLPAVQEKLRLLLECTHAWPCTYKRVAQPLFGERVFGSAPESRARRGQVAPAAGIFFFDSATCGVKGVPCFGFFGHGPMKLAQLIFSHFPNFPFRLFCLQVEFATHAG
jgi:hypothetical protein